MGERYRIFVVISMLVVFFATSPHAWAQSDAILRGQVVVAADRSALPHATVTLKPAGGGEPRQAHSDEAGRFAFAQLPPGVYMLSVSIDGFAPFEATVSLEPREVAVVPVTLQVQKLDVAVSVIGDAHMLASTHSPSSTVLSAARLETLPMMQRHSLPDAIVTSAPGMIRGHDDFVHIRGHEVALNPLINGVGFWENPHSALSAGVSPEIIDTANVMTGGFPAEYGNRFGGVVDVVTKSGLRMEGRGAATLSFGNEGRRRGAVDAGGRRGAFGYFVFGAAFETDRFLSPPDPRAIHDSARGGNVFARLDRVSDRLGSFNVLLMGDANNAQIPKSPIDVELRPLANATQRTRQQTATLGWTRTWSNTVANASAYQRWSRLRLLPASGPLTAEASMRRELSTIGGKADATRLAGRHTFKFGIDAVRLAPEEDLRYNYEGYRQLTHVLGLPHIHIRNRAVIAFSDEASGGQVSAYAQDGIQMGRVTADLGVRLDRHSLVVTETHVSPRVNVVVRAGAALLHTSYNHFFVPPAVEGILSSSAGLTEYINEIGGALPALRATTEDQFEVGGSAPIGPFQAALTGYYRNTDNPVHTTVWPDSRIYSYASFDRARAYGLEAKIDVPRLVKYGITGYANYALGRVYFYNPVTGGFITDAAHISDTSRFLAPMDQTHTFTGGATYRHAPTGAWMGMTVEYGSGTPVGHGGSHDHAEGEDDHSDGGAGVGPRVPEHFTAGVSLGLDLMRDSHGRPRMTLRLDVENIANKAYVIARESGFSPAQYSSGRLIAVSTRVRF